MAAFARAAAQAGPYVAMVRHDAFARSPPRTDPGPWRASVSRQRVGLVLEVQKRIPRGHAVIPRGHAVGNGLRREPRDSIPDFLLDLGLRPGMNRSEGNVPEAKAADQPACDFQDTAHAEAVHDPPPDAGDGPAPRLVRIGVGSELRQVVTAVLRSPSSICGRAGQALSRKPSRRAQPQRFTR